MKIEFIPKIVTLLAGAVVCIVSIVKHMDVTYSLEVLLAVLIIFYIIGCIAKKIIQKTVNSNMFVKNNEIEYSNSTSQDNTNGPDENITDTSDGNSGGNTL